MPELFTVTASQLAGRLIEVDGLGWRAFTHHAFVARLQDGSLPPVCFRHYLIQDYRFLIHFARAWALLAVKSETVDDIREAAATVHALIDEELKLHVSYCTGFGIDETVMAATAEAPANLAYTRFVLERGFSGDALDLLVALLPCVTGYAEIGARLMAEPSLLDGGNPYRAWIETYGGRSYQATNASVVAMLERVAVARLGQDPVGSPRWADLCRTFQQAVLLETGFWQMGLDAA